MAKQYWAGPIRTTHACTEAIRHRDRKLIALTACQRLLPSRQRELSGRQKNKRERLLRGNSHVISKILWLKAQDGLDNLADTIRLYFLYLGSRWRLDVFMRRLWQYQSLHLAIPFVGTHPQIISFRRVNLVIPLYPWQIFQSQHQEIC